MGERSIRPETRERLRRLAGLVFHAALPVYLIGLFLTLLKWNDPSPEGTYWAKVLMHGARIGMTAAFAEQLLREGRRAWIRAAVLVLGLISAQISQPWYLYDLALLAFLSELAEVKTTGRLLLWAHGVMALAALWLRETGIVTEQLENGRFAVEAFGLSNVNALGAFWMSVTLTVWVIWLREKPLFGGLLCWTMGAVILWRTRCGTAAALLFAFPVLHGGLTALRRRGRSLGWTLWAPGLMCLLSLVGTGWFMAGDRAVPSGALGTILQRFADATEALRREGISLFGRQVTGGGLTDNLYLYTLLVFGIGGLALLLGGMTWALRESVRRDRTEITALAVLFAIYGVMEGIPVLMTVFNFVPILLLASPGGRETAPVPGVSRRTRAVWSVCAAAVCAVLAFAVPAGEGYGTSRRVVRNGFAPVGLPLTAQARERQTFVSDETELHGLSLLMAVGPETPEGTLVLTLEDENGALLEEKRGDAARIGENRYWTVLFDRAYPPGRYAASVRTEDWKRGEAAVHQNRKNRYAEGALWVDGKETKWDWAFGLVFRTVSGRRAAVLAALAAAAALISLAWIWPSRRPADGGSAGEQRTEADGRRRT